MALEPDVRTFCQNCADYASGIGTDYQVSSYNQPMRISMLLRVSSKR